VILSRLWEDWFQWPQLLMHRVLLIKPQLPALVLPSSPARVSATKLWVVVPVPEGRSQQEPLLLKSHHRESEI